jgi:hypothetical protein
MLSTDIAMATDTLPGVLYLVEASMIFVAQEQEVVVPTGNQVVPVVQAEEQEEAAAAAALLSILLEVEALAEVEIW